MRILNGLNVTLSMLVILLTAQGASAMIDVSRYQLTAKQIEVLERFSQKGYSDEALDQMAQTFQRTNTRPAVYIPVYSAGDLDAVMNWAVGHAYAHFAAQANVKFNEDAFMADCPNSALFGFGKATGTAFLPVDVLWLFNNEYFALNFRLQQNPAGFHAVYLEYIRESQFAKYVDASEWNRYAELDAN